MNARPAAFLRRTTVAAIGLLGGTLPAFAQAIEVSVFEQGTLRPLAGLEVSIHNPETTFDGRATTDAQGKAHFLGLSTAGSWTVRVKASDAYSEVSAEGLSLRSNFERSVSLVLAPRAARATESVTVTAEPGSAELNAVNAEISATLSAHEIEGIAVEGRDLTRVLHRLPSVVPATGFYPEAPNVSINGANSLYTNYMVDGLDNNENFLGGQKFALPSGFAQQITVLTSNYSAEFGRTGNGILNVTSRSGANDVHGEAFYLSRPGPAIDAASPFPQRDLSGNFVKGGFARNQAGFGLGGPIARDRSFFFVNAEYTRDRKDNLLNVPELGVLESIRGHNQFLYLSGKLDQRLTDRWTSSLRLNVGRVNIQRQGGGLDGGVTFPSAADSQDRDSVLAAARAVYAGADTLVESALQYARFRWNYGRPANPGSPQVRALGPSGETLAILGHPGFVFDDLESTLQTQEKVSLRKGRHNLKAGLDLVSAAFALSGGGNVNGNYTVELTQAQVEAVRGAGRGSALDVQDLPADTRVLAYNVELQPKAFGNRQNLLGVYLEDLFAATGRLNVALGLRYDYDNLSRGGASKGDTNNLGVRLALNHRLDARSVVRGGFGVFYDKVLYAYWSDALQQNSTASGYLGQLRQLQSLGLLPADTDLRRVSFDGNLSAGYVGVPYLNGPTSAEAQAERERVTSFERRILNPGGYPNPRTEQFALGYQRQLGPHQLFYLDLLHARSSGLPRLRDLNAPTPYPIDPGRVTVRTETEADATRPVALVPGGARSVIVTENAGRSRYGAVNLTFLKDRGGDLYAWRVSYTLSKLLNDTDDINFRAQDANAFAAEYGPSINDRRHVLSAVAWAYPLKNISMSLAGLLQSGQPINRIPDARIFGTTDLNGDGRRFGDAYVGNSDRWPGASRNGDRLPWSFVFDLAAGYALPVGTRKHLELRADVFNVFNHPNLSGYGNNATQSNQIQIGPPGAAILEKNAGAPRQFQLGVRYLF